MSSYTFAETFTRTHARRLAGRVTTDLRQSGLFYGQPSESMLEQYRQELEELLTGGYVARYQFGYARNGAAVWSMRYIVGLDGFLTATGMAGGVPCGINIDGASFFNFLTFSDAWYALIPTARKNIESKLPFTRTTGRLPSDAYGIWTRDRVYTAGGVALDRAVFWSWQ
jgi:hypothetical protein